jgi:predicted nucleotidyltransferase
MTSLPQHFAQLVESTNPSGERLSIAQTWPERIRDHLREHNMETESPHSRLSGSYARKTAVREIKDVDILVFFPDEAEDANPYSVLADLEDALGDFPDTRLDLTAQRRSVRVVLPEDAFELDVVPAVAPESIDGILKVPDRDRSLWLDSQPLGYGKALSDLNLANSSRVKPMIRLLKLWRDLHMVYKRPKSYWLECLVFRAFDGEHVSAAGVSVADIFTSLLAYFDERLSPTVDAGGVPHIPDPMLGNNVAGGWTHGEAKAFLSHVRQCRRWASRALDSDEESEAIELWQKVFPGEFPPTVSDSGLKRSILSGEAAVTPGGIILGSRQGATKVKPHRAYGLD